MAIQLKGAYDPFVDEDGYLVLVDRVWPRGLSKELLKLDQWLKEIGPSTALRKWFGHGFTRMDTDSTLSFLRSRE